MRQKAIDLLTYYLIHGTGNVATTDNLAEIAEIVDCIIAAAVEEIERRMEGVDPNRREG